MPYRITITADKYPVDFTIEASNVATAAARGMRAWRQRFKGSRASEWTIRIVRG